MRNSSIKKAVFPVAGLGTRFLPATKANPKEMLPIVDKPLIQYAVDEAIQAGITDLIFVTSSSKRAIEDHFDSNQELEAKLFEKGKYHLVELVRNILPSHVNCFYVRQQRQLGLGHAVLCAQPLVHDEPFAVLLADDLINTKDQPGCLAQMIEAFDLNAHAMLAVETVHSDQISRYGVIEPAHQKGKLTLLSSIVEKPKPDCAPSNLGVVGRYILSPVIFDYLSKAKVDASGEIQLTDAIAQCIAHDQSVIAYDFDGDRYDCGSKLGYLKAMVAYGSADPTVGDAFSQFLKEKFVD